MAKSIQRMMDELKPYTPMIEWGAVSQKWHITLKDFWNDGFAYDSIREGLEAAQHRVQRTAIAEGWQSGIPAEVDKQAKARGTSRRR